MRIRTKNTVRASVTELAVPVNVRNEFGTVIGPYYPAGGVIPIDFDEEFIADVTGRKQGHACVQRAKTTVLMPGNTVLLPYAYREALPLTHTPPFGQNIHDGPGYLWYRKGQQYADWFAWNMHTMATPAKLSVIEPQVDEDIIYNDLLDKVQGLVAEHGQNIIEMDDLEISIKSIFSRPFYTDHFRWRLAYEKCRLLKQMGKYSSGAYLAYKFGFQPLFADMVKTRVFLEKFRSKFQRFKEKKVYHTSKSYGLTTKIPASSDISPDEVTNGYTVIHNDILWIPDSQGTYLRYTMVARPVARYVTDAINRIDFVMKRLLGTPVQLGWELLPYSFIVDWFWDVRSCVRAIEAIIGTNAYEVLGCYKTRKWQGTVTIHNTRRNSLTGGMMSSQDLASLEMKSYERSLLKPGFLPVLKWRFGKNQAAISAALLTQLIARAKRW